MLSSGRVPGTVQRFLVLAEEVLPLPLRQFPQDPFGSSGSWCCGSVAAACRYLTGPQLRPVLAAGWRRPDPEGTLVAPEGTLVARAG